MPNSDELLSSREKRRYDDRIAWLEHLVAEAENMRMKSLDDMGRVLQTTFDTKRFFLLTMLSVAQALDDSNPSLAKVLRDATRADIDMVRRVLKSSSDATEGNKSAMN